MRAIAGLRARLRRIRRLAVGAGIVVATATAAWTAGIAVTSAGRTPEEAPEASAYASDWPYDAMFAGDNQRSALSVIRGKTPTPRPRSQTEAPDIDAPFVWPAEGWIVQGMWPGHPSGIDIGVATGEPVRAIRDGTIAFVGGDPCCGYGRFIMVAHDGGWASLYAHLSAFDAKLGDKVRQGEVIGRAGATGTVTGPHLHFELRSYGVPVDPLLHLIPYREAPPPPPPETPTAEPPPLRAAGDAAPRGAGGAPPASPGQPEAPGDDLTALAAMVLAADWMLRNADAGYVLDASQCQPSRMGPNWFVSCYATLEGCLGGDVCRQLLSACVLDEPRLVTAACP